MLQHFFADGKTDRENDMKASSGRFFYDLIFWAVVLGLVYLNRRMYQEAETTLTPVFQAYTTVVLFLICVGLFLLVLYLREAIVNTFVALTMRVSGENPLNYEKGNLQSNIQKSARRLEKKGDFQGAGEAYESLELWRDAAMVYERGNVFGRAAAAWHAAGVNGKAIELFEKDRNYEAAGNLCLSEGLQDRAAKNFRIAGDKCLEANQFAAAADYYEKAHEFNKAGGMFENAHKLDRALYCYEKANNTDKLLELVDKISPADYHRRGAEFTKLVQRSAECLAAAGSAKEAAKILEDCHDFLRAAEVNASCNDWEKAAELYLKAGRKDLAEKAIERIDDKKAAADLSARIAVENGDWQRAGEHFEAAGKQNQAIDSFKKARNFDAAARIYEAMGRYIMAGEMYSSGKNLTAAANVYAKAYDWRNAAECFEASGDSGQAIEAYANSGNFLKAGTLAIKMTDYARAIEYLQRIPSASPDFRAGTAFLATAFYYQCHYDMATELFNRVMDDLPINKDTLPVYYAYASSLQGENPKKSLGLFRQILGVDVHYSDVADRVQKLEQIVTSLSSGFGNNTPIPAAGSGISLQTPLPVHDRTPATAVPSSFSTVATSSPGRVFNSSSSSQLSGLNTSPLDGRYKLKDQLSQAGRITDYQAIDTLADKTVIVRTFPRPDDPVAAKKTLDSLSNLSQLSHPGISGIIAFGESQGMIYIVYPQVNGQNLKQWIRTSGPMSIGDLRIFSSQVLNTLGYAHSQRHYHQNLRPELINIPEKLDDRIVISGFGSPLREANPVESVYMTVPDSDPQFLAPEQIIGAEVDERTDIYAMGLIIFFALTGRTPFEVKRINDTQEIARMQVQVSLPRPSTIRATLPTSVDDIFQKCVNKSAAHRYQSAVELLADINGLHTQTSI